MMQPMRRQRHGVKGPLFFILLGHILFYFIVVMPCFILFVFLLLGDNIAIHTEQI
jgi:hypothetical protein